MLGMFVYDMRPNIVCEVSCYGVIHSLFISNIMSVLSKIHLDVILVIIE